MTFLRYIYFIYVYIYTTTFSSPFDFAGVSLLTAQIAASKRATQCADRSRRSVFCSQTALSCLENFPCGWFRWMSIINMNLQWHCRWQMDDYALKNFAFMLLRSVAMIVNFFSSLCLTLGYFKNNKKILAHKIITSQWVLY